MKNKQKLSFNCQPNTQLNEATDFLESQGDADHICKIKLLAIVFCHFKWLFVTGCLKVDVYYCCVKK